MITFDGNNFIKKEHLDFVDHVVSMLQPNIVFDETYDWLSIESVIVNSLSCKNKEVMSESLKEIIRNNIGKDCDFLKLQVNNMV